MNREEAIKHLETYSTTLGSGQTTQAQHEEAKRMAIKALEREQQKYTRPRHCDCCGVLLTEDNNKCGYELCDECNERLEQSMERGRNEQKRSEFYIGKH